MAVSSSDRKDSCNSPKTARFNSIQNQLMLKQSKIRAAGDTSSVLLDISHISRENIK